tara:strand:- start:72 stop:548 length:477 start_codon:yes stop_codon:yes gene_type:complete
MLPRIHIISGAIFALVLYLIFPYIGFLEASIIFLASFLIDVDHYIYYVYKTRKLGLRGSFLWYFKNKNKFFKMSKDQRKKVYVGLCALHGIESIIILLVLVWVYTSFSFLFLSVAIGFIFHQVLDFIDINRRELSTDKVFSFTYSIIQSKNKKLLQEF